MVLNNEITQIDEQELKDQVKTIYEYIKYIYEQLNFWASARERERKEGMASLANETDTAFQQIAAVTQALAALQIPSARPLAAGTSKTIDAGTYGGLIALYRSTKGTPTVAFVDQWGGISYLSQNADMTLSVSGSVITVTNGCDVYIDVAFIPFSN